ncbi:MAG: hypothetical protein J7J98_09025 [candidate division Zixibacteria bacterium]|nr:hypothetical protein [candidate division Zixibacteria bacterium]
MAPILMVGTVIVNLALIFYSIGIFIEQHRHKITQKALLFLTLGIAFDIVATTCMIIGSTNSPFSLHGLLGYSSLMVMLIETTLAWRHRLRAGDGEVSSGLHLYSRIAYFWWVAAFVTGALIVFCGS